MSTEVERYFSQGVASYRPNRQQRRALVKQREAAEVKAQAIDLQGQLGQRRLSAVATTTEGAFIYQAALSATEEAIVLITPGAVNAIAYLSQKGTQSLGRVLDKVIDEVCR